MLKLAIDIGGTFTDIVAENASGLWSIKVLTSPSAPETAALEGTSKLLNLISADFSEVDSVVHGTTLATNALIERRGANTALITTAGFRDVLEMRNEKRFDQYDLNIEMPQPLVSRPLRIGLQERTLANGDVFKEPIDSEIDSVCQQLVKYKVEAVAIGFLHAYRNNANEKYVASRLRSQLDDQVTICQSAEVAGEIREFERFSTVCANAYVRPLMMHYLSRLESQLRQKGFNGSFLMMLSDGALTTIDQAKRFPVRLVEGGPAGGVALGAHVAREVNSNKALSLDIGGTTAKICFIENGQPQTSRSFEVARAWRDTKGSGLPIKVPAVELVEIGAGGGSIATVDSLGRLKTGPQSAGSEPGPAAYNQGGEDPTVTDAHVVTGSIAAAGFADGMIELAPQRAEVAVAKNIQTPLDFTTVEEAAAGVIELANETMANAARVHGIELGLDVASFDLLVSGGGGGLHAARIAEKLGISRIIVPANAGVGSAVGFLRSPVAFETALSVIEAIGSINLKHLDARLQTAQAYVSDVVSQAVQSDKISISIMAEMRYRGQGLELRIPLHYDSNLQSALIGAQEKFKDQYQASAGFTLAHIAVELVSLSVKAQECDPQKRSASKPSAVDGDSDPASTNVKPIVRDVYDQHRRSFCKSRVIPRPNLKGEALQGPLVVSESQTTTVVPEAWCVYQSQHGHLILERRQ